MESNVEIRWHKVSKLISNEPQKVVGQYVAKEQCYLWLFHCDNKTSKMVRYLRYGNILIFCSHYYWGRAGARVVDLPATRPGVCLLYTSDAADE